MAHVYCTALAKSDFLALWRRIAEEGHSPLNAERFLWKLDTQCQTLAAVPFMGVARPEWHSVKRNIFSINPLR
jgi:plasmid stabilization system protein ParE